MNRRQYLIRGCAGVSIASLAGCLGDLTDSASSSGGDRTGERALDRAAGNLNDAALALDIGGDTVEDPEELEFDPEEPNGLIDDGREHLETAASELDGDRESDIAILRTYADILEALVVVTDTIADDTLEDDMDAVSEALGGDGDIEDANAILEARTAELETAQTRHDEAVDNFQDLDERFEELARIERADLESGISTLGDVLGSLVTLGDGFDSMLTGYEDLERGQDHIDDEEYKRAKAAFSDAESAFETATATLESDEETPDGLTSYFETAICQSGHLTDAAVAFEDAAAAMDRGDFITADRRRSDGERALEDANDC